MEIIIQLHFWSSIISQMFSNNNFSNCSIALNSNHIVALIMGYVHIF
jgi:hypothetical protein